MTHPTHKLRTKHYGPFKVTNTISHVAYQLQLPVSWKIHNVFHASYLSPYKEAREHGSNFVEPPSDIIEGEPEWEVEAIVGMRLFGRRKQKQYCVQWRGYVDAYDTWEPEENIHVPRLIEQYLQSQQMIIRATQQKSGTDIPNIPIPDLVLVSPPESPLNCKLPSGIQTTPKERIEVKRAVAQPVKKKQEKLPSQEVRPFHHEPLMGTQAKDGQSNRNCSFRRELTQQQSI
jgi:hypothetical protein